MVGGPKTFSTHQRVHCDAAPRSRELQGRLVLEESILFHFVSIIKASYIDGQLARK